jgi:predicted acyl esterase
MSLRVRVSAALGSFLLLIGSVPAALAAPAPAGPVFVEGQAQVVPEFNVSSQWIRHSLWVQTEFDSDGDGLLDRVFVDVTRPQQTDTEGLKVPVVYESSPYYAGTASTASQYFWNVNHELGATPLPRTSPPDITYQAGRTSISTSEVNTWVPRGFAVVHSDSVGTGLSDGCPTVGGINESLAPKAVVDWLNGRTPGFTTRAGTTQVQAYWSTGKVGMTGTSYNGTLPLAAATTGVDGLEAIIPIAPNTSYYHYYRSNGLVRNPGGWVGEDVDYLFDYISSGIPAKRAYCRANVREGLMKAQHDRVTGDYNAFWSGRDYLNQLDNVHAAVFMAHAFNDWNVVPEHSVRIYEALKGRGIPLMAYYHQNGHGGAPPLPLRNLWFSRFLYGIQNGIENDPKGWIVRQEAGQCPVRSAVVTGDQSNTATLLVNSSSAFNRGLTLTIPQTNLSGTITNTTREILAIPNSTTLQLASPVATAAGQRVANGAIVSMGCTTTNPTPYADYPNPAAAPVTLNLQAGGTTTGGGGLSLASPSATTETFNDIVTCRVGGLTTLAAQAGNRLLFKSPVLSNPVHISGFTSVNVRLASSKQAANLSITLVKLPWTGGSTCTSDTQQPSTSVITRGWADPKNHGNQFGIEQPLTPGEFVDMSFQIEPDDQVIPAGSQIGLVIHSSDPEFTVRPVAGTQVSIDLSATNITLPVVGGADAFAAATGATPPTASFTLDPASPDGNNGWYVAPVTIDWSVDDGGAHTTTIGCVDETITDEGDPLTRSCDATSVLGTDSVTATFRRDATPPEVSVTGVTDGAVYVLGTEPAPGCSTSDALSGVASEASLTVSGGPTVGFFTADCDGAADNAGNTASASAAYQVVYDFGGFGPPVSHKTTAKAGSAVPVKFTLAGFQGMNILLSGSPTFQQTNCATDAPIGAAVSTTANNPLSYEGDRYKYVWKTKKEMAGCGTFTLSFIDGTTQSVEFVLN